MSRLPELSVIVCQTGSEDALYLPIEPIDAGVEALRSALQTGAIPALVDLDVEGYGEYRDSLPDTYAVLRIGAAAFYEAVHRAQLPRDRLDPQREAAMAYHLQRLRETHGGPVLLVCGMAHAQAVIEQVERPQGIPFARPRQPDAALFNLHPDCLPEVLALAPAVEAVYELLRDGPLEPEPPAPLERPSGRRVGPFRILEGSGSLAGGEYMSLLRRAARRSGAPLDRLRLQSAFFDLAIGSWQERTGETLRPWQREVFARFARNLSLLSGRLVADPYDTLLAVRGVGDENLLYEAHQLLMNYPWQREPSDMPSVSISAEELDLESRRLRIRPRLRQPKRRLFPVRTRRDKERYPGEWLEGFDESGLCSYPPEDLVIEGYARFLRKKGKALLSEENVRVEPFRTSLLDGIDMRETLRHWASERRIYVRERGRVHGEVGSIVLIFDEDADQGSEERFPYRMTWLGEHAQESDMAFYSTSPGQGIQGPGISRCQYGGFLMSYPPRRLDDVWSDPDYSAARCKSEVLLLAALDYSEERVIVYVASRPPSSILRALATRLDRKIVYIPIGTLSADSLRSLRTFHVLAGRSKREVARDYIW